MRLDKLAVTAQEAFQNAMGVAGEADAAVIEPIHLLKALLDSDENNLAAIVKRIGADPVWLSQNVADEIAKDAQADWRHAYGHSRPGSHQGSSTTR